MEADVKGTVTNVTNSRYDYLLKKKSDEYKVVQEEERKKVTNQFEEERKLEELKHKHKMQILMLWLGFFLILFMLVTIFEALGWISR